MSAVPPQYRMHHIGLNHFRMCATKKRILLLCCMLLFFCGQAFSQDFRYEVLSPPWTGMLVRNVCWARGNVDKPGTLVEYPLKVGMLYQWSSQGWIATNPFLKDDTIISVENPCPAGWRMPTMEESMSFDQATKSEELFGLFKTGIGMPINEREGMCVVFGKKVGENRDEFCFPVLGFPPENTPATPRYGYWTGTLDAEDGSKAWGYTIFESSHWGPQPVLAPRDYPFFVRCVKEKCDTIVENPFVTIFPEDLPYKWGDTTFQVGTESGIYRFQQSNCAFNRTVNLHLTVKPCPGVLINGVCWAEYNVDEPGTFANPGKPFGMLYQWNRKKGWPATGDVTGWDSSLEPGDTWEPANDPCPAGWRIPTDKELETLLDETKVSKVKIGQNRILGMRYIDHATDNMVFFPQINHRAAGGTVVDLCHAYYWSSTERLILGLDDNATWHETYNVGNAVRCVADENACDIVLTASKNICKEELPYTWHDTTFLAGTTTGEYRIRRTNPTPCNGFNFC